MPARRIRSYGSVRPLADLRGSPTGQTKFVATNFAVPLLRICPSYGERAACPPSFFALPLGIFLPDLLVVIYDLFTTFIVFPFRTTPAYPPLIHRVSTAYPPHPRVVSLFGRCGGCAADKRWISGGSAGVRFSLSDLFQRIRRRFGRDEPFLDHVAHMEGLDDLPEGSHVHMHVLQLPRSPAPNGNVSAFPQTNFHLRRNENLHFTLYLQGCSDFHAPKIGEPPMG